jgi:nucleoside-diphosphate-sugar epimerase
MNMHIVVTGASGFVGQALVARLLRDHEQGLRRLEALTLLDVNFAGQPAGPVRQVAGSIADAAVVAQAFAQDVDQVFHLASIPGGTAEQHYALSRDVNLLGTQNLLEAAKAQAERGAAVARFVFASTIAVYGAPLPACVDDDTALNPQMSYGAQKLIGEILVADFSRRSWVNGCSLRLPGVLARPPARTGQLSAFMSDIIRELAAGRAFTCPTSPQASIWASSVHNVVDNLLHAAQVDSARLPARRALALPTLHFTMGQLVEALAAVHGPRVRELIRWAPDERIETLFGHYPPLATPAADAAGFRNDGDLPTLVRRAIEPF